MRRNRIQINGNTAIKIVLLLGYAAFYLSIIFTGSVNQYVHPRIIPYMIFASIVMTIIALLLFGELFCKPQSRNKSFSLLFFLVPLIMAFALPAQTFDSNARAMEGLELTDDTQVYQVEEETPEANYYERELELQDGVLVMDNANFYLALMEVYEKIEQYDGTKVELVGFVFRDSELFAENEFVPARFLMTCCVADMVPVGFLCRYEGAKELPLDSWVKVTGVIAKAQYQGNEIPIIQAEEIESAEKPQNDYVYPY